MTVPVQLGDGLVLARWSCVRERLRAIVGEEHFAAWFAGLKCEGIQGDSIYLSVATRFIKCWIEEHHAETVRTACQTEMPGVEYIGIGVRNGLHVAPRRPQVPSPLPILLPSPRAATSTASIAATSVLAATHPFDNVPNHLAQAVAGYLSRADEAGCRDAATASLLNFLKPQPATHGRIQRIQIAVAEHYGISRTDLISARRTWNVVQPRQVAIYLAKTLTGMSLPQIGRQFGGRDHTTILHAVNKIERLCVTDKHVAIVVDILLQQFTPPEQSNETIGTHRNDQHDLHHPRA